MRWIGKDQAQTRGLFINEYVLLSQDEVEWDRYVLVGLENEIGDTPQGSPNCRNVRSGAAKLNINSLAALKRMMFQVAKETALN
jgi:hypothetical protein